ncbi:S1 family peptidase [Streptomyces sp. DSM 42041]|uniref:S1 family peptidase n=1 Tax=Streptomyces hazeniae TaxID=3075538 RepID=A0ABU2NZC0_9ACTN|nr:S1 family peptidase [Streptomyces sp. DSM 42041]MDT0382335.1 S1 family peptidase [Streptomyces sp. DSM 42041]
MTPTSRALRTAVAVLAGCAALALPAPVVAADEVPGHAPSVEHAALTSLAAEEGVSRAEAAEILRRQDDGIRALDRLTAELGRQSAGAYLDDRGRPVVNVLGDAAADRVRAAGATPKRVTRTTAELRTVRSALEALPAVAHTTTATDPVTQQVVVTLTDTTDARGAARLRAAAAEHGDAVRVEETHGAMSPAIRGGAAITGGGIRCSAGFNTRKNGQNYIIDAGHCTKGVANWSGIGPSVGASFPGNDYGLIRNRHSNAPGVVTLYNGDVQRIDRAGAARVGQRICKSGSTTGLTCGTVQRTGVTVNYPQGQVRQLVQTAARVNSGDSGGALFDGRTALGITSGMGGGSSFFQPVREVLNRYNVRLN